MAYSMSRAKSKMVKMAHDLDDVRFHLVAPSILRL